MSANSFTLPSFAKVNLFLKIIGKRADGFHELSTVFQTVSLHDKLTFSEDDSLILSSDDKNIPIDESNLIIKAGRKLLAKTGKSKGAKIHLEKKIPFPGGLGGGSSNAAVALMGLATLWDFDISLDELCEIGKEIGSDVPFFLYGGTAFGMGRGTEISDVKSFEENHMVIITPNIEISTPKAFSKIDALDLTKVEAKSILKICREEALKLDSGHLKFTNDFEDSVFKIEPKIKQIKDKLLELEAKEALLAGSGASVFALFDNKKKQQIALSAFENDLSLQKFAVKTISRKEYLNYLEPCKSLLPKSF